MKVRISNKVLIFNWPARVGSGIEKVGIEVVEEGDNYISSVAICKDGIIARIEENEKNELYNVENDIDMLYKIYWAVDDAGKRKIAWGVRGCVGRFMGTDKWNWAMGLVLG